jgi:hypothetical protein
VNAPREIGSATVRFLGSYGLACILFLTLFVLTAAGTWAQRNQSLYDVQQTYFVSWFFFSDYLPWIPLPGAASVLAVLFVNLIVGGFLRMRRSWSRVGIFIVHFGVAFLLLAGLVELVMSKKGMMTVREGETKREFESPYEWDVSVLEQLQGGRERVYTIPYEELPGPGKTARYGADGLPFELELSGYLRNCRPRAAHAGTDSIDGIVMESRGPAEEAEQNVPGITVKLIQPGGVEQKALLWGLQAAPYATKVAGRRFAVDIHRRSWPLPYSITLRKFTRELHPRTGIDSRFASDITRVQDNVAQDVHISMNEPMREGGYTFYQSGWGPPDAPPSGPFYSTFSVVQNPADLAPWIAVTIIGVGLAVHFLLKLWNHIVAEAKRRT